MSLPAAWDSFGAYLFDIDGTLLNCSDRVHYFAFCDVLSLIAGRPVNLDGVIAHGNTDVGILRDAFALAGVPEDCWRPRLPEIREQMCRQVEQNKASLCIHVLPRVREVLTHLKRKGAFLSIASGNLEHIGKQKLAAAGLLDLFELGAWTDAFEFRSDIVGHAIEQVRLSARDSATIVAVGDTPADIVAARANGLPVVAVATGIYSYEELAAKRPSLCLRTLGDLLGQRNELVGV